MVCSILCIACFSFAIMKRCVTDYFSESKKQLTELPTSSISSDELPKVMPLEGAAPVRRADIGVVAEEVRQGRSISVELKCELLKLPWVATANFVWPYQVRTDNGKTTTCYLRSEHFTKYPF